MYKKLTMLSALVITSVYICPSDNAAWQRYQDCIAKVKASSGNNVVNSLETCTQIFAGAYKCDQTKNSKPSLVLAVKFPEFQTTSPVVLAQRLYLMPTVKASCLEEQVDRQIYHSKSKPKIVYRPPFDSSKVITDSDYTPDR